MPFLDWFFDELKPRKVCRVAVAYVIAAAVFASLKFDPAMDRLQDHPNFQILLKKCESTI